MKKLVQLLGIGIILIYFFSSCSIEKRRYTPGYSIQWKNSKYTFHGNETGKDGNADRRDRITVRQDSALENVFNNETVTVSANNSITLPNHINKKEPYDINALLEECAVITLKNGDEIQAKVSEILQDEVKYKKCDDLNGQTFTLRKSEVFMIKYPNGTKDIMAQETSQQTKNNPGEREDNGVFGILSFVSIVLGVVLSATGAGAAILFLVPAAIIFGAVGLGRKRKLRGLAMAGLIIGCAGALLILILIAALSNLGN